MTKVAEIISHKIDNMVKIIDLLERRHTINRISELCGNALSNEIKEYKTKEMQRIMEELEKLNN